MIRVFAFGCSFFCSMFLLRQARWRLLLGSFFFSFSFSFSSAHSPTDPLHCPSALVPPITAASARGDRFHSPATGGSANGAGAAEADALTQRQADSGSSAALATRAAVSGPASPITRQ